MRQHPMKLPGQINLIGFFLIRLGLSFQKPKFLYSNTKEPTASGRHRKAFIGLQSSLTDSRWICLILLIKLIQYKIGKHQCHSDWVSVFALIYSVWTDSSTEAN